MLGIEAIPSQRVGQTQQSTDGAQAIQQAGIIVGVVGTGQGIVGFGLQVRVRVKGLAHVCP